MSVAPSLRRILLKLSGEALMGREPHGIDMSMLQRIAREVKELADLGVQTAVVVGGGNIFRGEGLARGGDGSRHRGPHGDAGHGD